MTTRSHGQNWSLDIALAEGGFDALHPGAKGTLEQLGYDPTDFDKVFAQVASGAMLPKAWSVIAAQAQERARHHELHGFARTASDMYLRAAVMYGRAQYSIFDSADARKAALRARCDQCVDRLCVLRGNTVRRVEMDFDGATLFGLLHLPGGEVVNAPAVILGPGMDMIKEDYIYAAERFYTARGVVALSIEGPGQGQTRSLGLTVGLDNYERAIETYAAYLAGLPQVDPARIGMFGISMSGYWALRALANRILCCAPPRRSRPSPGTSRRSSRKPNPASRRTTCTWPATPTRMPSTATSSHACRSATWSRTSPGRS